MRPIFDFRFLNSLLLATIFLCGCDKTKTPDLQPNEVKLEATLSPSEIFVGDSAELLVTLYAPANSSVEETPFPKEIELQNRHFESEEISKTHQLVTQRFDLTSFELGEFALTNGFVTIASDGSAQTNFIENVTLKINSSLENPDDQTLSELKPPIKEKPKYAKLLAVAGIVVLIALIAGLLTMWFMKRKKQIENAPEIIIPAHILALSALTELKNSGVIEAEDSYKFYFELSQIWRDYLGNRFDLHAPESTTEEIAALLAKSNDLSADQKSMLQQFLQQADMIKFAKETQTSDEMNRSFSLCEEFVDATKADETEVEK